MRLVSYRKPAFYDQWLARELAPKSTYQPRVDVQENKQAYEVVLTIPGYRKDELSINLEDQVLSITATLATTEGEGAPRRNGGIANFTRRFQLPEGINADGVTAGYEAGILTVIIPKAEKVTHKQVITVQ